MSALRYQILGSSGLVENVILLEPDNVDGYAAALTDGRTLRAETPENRDAPRWAPPPRVPESVSRVQFHKALLGLGILPSAVEGVLREIVDPVERETALIDWASPVVRRDNALLIARAPQFGFTTTAALDALFIRAEAL